MSFDLQTNDAANAKGFFAFAAFLLFASFLIAYSVAPLAQVQKSEAGNKFLPLVKPFGLTNLLAVQPHENNTSYIFGELGKNVDDGKKVAVVTQLTLKPENDENQSFEKALQLFEKESRRNFKNVAFSKEGKFVNFSYTQDEDPKNYVRGFGWLSDAQTFTTLEIAIMDEEISETDLAILNDLKAQIKAEQMQLDSWSPR